MSRSTFSRLYSTTISQLQVASDQRADGSWRFHRRFVDPLFFLYDVLLIAFGVGVWTSAGGKGLVHVTAGLLVANAAVGLLGPTFFETNVRGEGSPGGDVPHIVLTGVLVLFILILAAIGVGAFTQQRWFRFYSFATLLALLVSGGMTGFEARHLASGEPTPWLGVFERINIGANLLWVAVLAISLLRSEVLLLTKRLPMTSVKA